MSRRGQRRHNNQWSRTLALFDALGVTKRRCELRTYLSREARTALDERAAALGVYPSALAAFLVEQKLREEASA